MGIPLAHQELLGRGAPLPLGEPGGQPRRDAHRAQQHHHRAGIVVAVAAPAIKQHPVYRIHTGRRGGDRLIIDDVRPQPALNRLGLVIRSQGVGLADDGESQFARAGGDAAAKLQIGIQHPGRVDRPGSAQGGCVGYRDVADDGVTVAIAQHLKRPDYGDIHHLPVLIHI